MRQHEKLHNGSRMAFVVVSFVFAGVCVCMHDSPGSGHRCVPSHSLCMNTDLL